MRRQLLTLALTGLFGTLLLSSDAALPQEALQDPRHLRTGSDRRGRPCPPPAPVCRAGPERPPASQAVRWRPLPPQEAGLCDPGRLRRSRPGCQLPDLPLGPGLLSKLRRERMAGIAGYPLSLFLRIVVLLRAQSFSSRSRTSSAHPNSSPSSMNDQASNQPTVDRIPAQSQAAEIDRLVQVTDISRHDSIRLRGVLESAGLRS